MQDNIKQIFLRKATISDYDFFYLIKSEGSNIYWTGHDKKPDYSHLKLWFEVQINNNKKQIFIIYLNQAKVGYGYLDILINNQIEINELAISEEFPKRKIGYCYIDKKEHLIVEISIGISETYQKQGLGTLAITAIRDYIRKKYTVKQIICWILDNNFASQKIFTKNHFIPTDEVRDQYIPLDEKTYLMRKYICYE